jgi:abortive infection bacteriophage resistance protein
LEKKKIEGTLLAKFSVYKKNPSNVKQKKTTRYKNKISQIDIKQSMNLTTIRRKRHSQVGFWDSRHMLQIIFYDLTNFFNQRNSGERGK